MDRGAIAARFAPHESLALALLDQGIDGLNDSAHDIGHVLRVWSNVRKIAATEGGDLRLLTAATLLHDGVAVAKGSPLRAQASRLSAAAARDRLSRLQWPVADINATSHAIESHSFSAGIPPETTEARVLQDADRLDALGFVGVARCFVVAGQMGRPLYDPEDPAARERPLDDTKWTLDHFETKLLKLAQGFQTATGRALAEQRHQGILAFRDGFLAEISC